MLLKHIYKKYYLQNEALIETSENISNKKSSFIILKQNCFCIEKQNFYYFSETDITLEMLAHWKYANQFSNLIRVKYK